MDKENVGKYIIKRMELGIDECAHDLSEWKDVVDKLKKQEPAVTVGVVGKYVELEDSYISIRESLKHAAAHIGVKVNIEWINAETEINTQRLQNLDSILIPGGFGERGINGKLNAVHYAIENKVPIFGICLGLHSMVIEFARMNGLENAHSTEFDETTEYPVIDMMEEQKKINDMGGTMRLGSYACKIKKGTIASESYQSEMVEERHRHRFEVNNEYRELLEKKGLIISGTSPDDFLVETIEIKDHPWFFGCQFHPEFKSRPERAHPIFISFMQATLDNK